MIRLTLALATLMLPACTPGTGDTPKAGEADTGTDAAADAYPTAWGSAMIRVAAGTFTMGGRMGDPDHEYENHEVTLTHDFYIGATFSVHDLNDCRRLPGRLATLV